MEMRNNLPKLFIVCSLYGSGLTACCFNSLSCLEACVYSKGVEGCVKLFVCPTNFRCLEIHRLEIHSPPNTIATLQHTQYFPLLNLSTFQPLANPPITTSQLFKSLKVSTSYWFKVSYQWNSADRNFIISVNYITGLFIEFSAVTEVIACVFGCALFLLCSWIKNALEWRQLLLSTTLCSARIRDPSKSPGRIYRQRPHLQWWYGHRCAKQPQLQP